VVAGVLVNTSDGAVGAVVVNDTSPVAAVLSPPPLMLAVLVSDAAAPEPTLAVMLIAGHLPLAASASVRVHVTTCAAIAQLQPVPLAVAGTRPAGNESVTVAVGPSVAPSPLFVATNEKVTLPPRVTVVALAVLLSVNDGAVATTVETVTDAVASDASPPPPTVAVEVSDAAALAATDTPTVIAG
jgi:hypothetical protein